MSVAATPARLEVRTASKSFGAVRVLDAVDLTLPPATILALLGTNGAGKSTLIKIISGIYGADSGTMLLDGAAVRFPRPRDAIEAGVSLLPQETSVIAELTVAENILLGQLPVRRGRLDRGALHARAKELLERVGLAIYPATPAERLSVQQLRLVEIARALSGNARVLILDEPTASLNEVEAEHLFVQLGRLREAGTSIIYISHYLDEVFAIADAIVVLRDGRVMGQFDPKVASEREVLEAMLGRTLDHLFPEAASHERGETLLRFDRATLGGMAPLDLAVARGEVVGVFGLLGSGYDRLGAEIFAGRSALVAGRVLWKGAPMPVSPAARITAGLGFVPAERKRDGIIPELDLTDNVCLPSLRRFDRGPRLDRGRMRDFTEREIARLSIKCDGPDQEIRELSGGNQQKAGLARWIDAGFDLIVMEEPTRGVDLGARADIYRQIRDYTKGGGGVLLISSDVEEVAGMADRSLVFEGGRIAAEFPRGADKAELMAAAARGAH
jgi:ribose transport system ATP-binding protein